jgi:hypothetical protein
LALLTGRLVKQNSKISPHSFHHVPLKVEFLRHYESVKSEESFEGRAAHEESREPLIKAKSECEYCKPSGKRSPRTL